VAISRAEELCSWKKVAAITGGYVDSLVGPIAATEKKIQNKRCQLLPSYIFLIEFSVIIICFEFRPAALFWRH